MRRRRKKSWRELNEIYDRILPQKLRWLRIPGWAITFAGWVADAVKHVIPFTFPLNK
jgi:hypothetical protein